MATFTVTTNADGGAGSLRAAVAAANALAGSDEIAFDAAVFDGGPGDVVRLTGGQIAVTDGLAIVGGPSEVTITGDADGDDVTLAGGITDVGASGFARLDDNSRIFDATADFSIDGLTLTGGHTSGYNESGGAIRSTADLRLSNSAISGNGTGDYGFGGGVSGVTVTITDSTVSGNSSGYYGDGGGVFASESITADGSTISDNYADASGGGLAAETLRVTNSVVRDNSTGYEFSGGGLLGLNISVESSSITGNRVSGGGGGGIVTMFSLTDDGSVRVIDSVVSDNVSSFGGGGIGGGRGDVYVAGSTISRNDAGDYAGEGGGIGGGAVTLVRSTVSDNRVGGYGGGIYASTSATVINSTVSGNHADPSYFYQASGGGVYSRGTVSVTQSTITGNTVGDSYYAGQAAGVRGQTITLENSIVLGNATYAGADDVQGNVVLTGGNILGPDNFDGAADVGDVTAADVFAATEFVAPGVLAGVLADNGGPTETVAIRADGPAAGAADPATALPDDQRGFGRDAAPDLGAFEAGASGGLALIGGPGAGYLVGGAFDDVIAGRGGDDRLRGLDGDDLILGGAGCDILKSGDGDDVMFGGRGRDWIGGGKGCDLMSGGAGADVFRFGFGFGDDRLLGFDADPASGQDRLDLRALGIDAAGFAARVTIQDLGADTRVVVGGEGAVLLAGVDGGGATGVDASDFLLLA